MQKRIKSDAFWSVLGLKRMFLGHEMGYNRFKSNLFVVISTVF